MSLKIIKAGILDSIQDTGRIGYRQYGINPSGSMDLFSAKKANILAGNNPEDAVIELHFPASTFQFTRSTSIVLSGGDFGAVVDDQHIPNDQLIFIRENAVLSFTSQRQGSRCYLSVSAGLKIDSWLNSKSTNFKAVSGGYHGRRLLKDDIISFVDPDRKLDYGICHAPLDINESIELLVLPGNEWDWVSEEGKDNFLKSDFTISAKSDRMGYTLTGPSISRVNVAELISSPVCFGTIQLLPDGQLIVLMADHQTTGGYPRIAHIISAHQNIIAQKKPGDRITFKLTDIGTAENLRIEQDSILLDLIQQIPSLD